MRLLKVEELEELSGISRHTWRAWIRQGKISVVRLGRCVRVREEDYQKLVQKNIT